MSKGVSEKFDEHERDTARREYPKEIVDGSKRTTKMSKFVDPGEIRTESGTRPAVTRDLIEKMRALPHHSGSPEDAHSRPTIELTKFTVTFDENGQPIGAIPTPSTGVPTTTLSTSALEVPPPMTLAPPLVTPLSSRVSAVDTAPAIAPVRGRSRIAMWVLGVILVGVVLMVSAAGVGFLFGRRSLHR